VDFRWIQQDYIMVIKRLQIYPVDPVDFWWISGGLWWTSGGLLVDMVDFWWILNYCGLLVDFWWILNYGGLLVDCWWIAGGSGGSVVDSGGFLVGSQLWWILVDLVDMWWIVVDFWICDGL